MKTAWKWIAGVLILAVLIVGARFAYDYLSERYNVDSLATQPTDTQPSEDGTQATQDNTAPDFTVYDADGNPVKLSDMTGKPVVVNFWASWCSPCKQEMPDFETLYKEYGEDVHFMMVNMTDGAQETKENAMAHVQENGYTFPVYYDTALSAANAYYVTSIPATYFVNAQGEMVTYARGMISAETLEKGINMILPE